MGNRCIPCFSCTPKKKNLKGYHTLKKGGLKGKKNPEGQKLRRLASGQGMISFSHTKQECDPVKG